MPIVRKRYLATHAASARGAKQTSRKGSVNRPSSFVIRDKASQLLSSDIRDLAGAAGAGSAATGVGDLLSVGGLASETLEPVGFPSGRQQVRGGGGGGGGDGGDVANLPMTLPAPHPLKQHGRSRIDKLLASCAPPHTRKGIVKGALCLRPMITGSESPAA